MLLTWAAETDKTYQVFYKDSLSELTWKPLAVNVVTQDSVAVIEDPDRRTQRFYQVTEQ